MDEESNEISLFIPTANQSYPVRDEEDGLQIQRELLNSQNVYSWLIYRN